MQKISLRFSTLWLTIILKIIFPIAFIALEQDVVSRGISETVGYLNTF